MNQVTDFYPSKPLSAIKEKPIGTAKFQEPVFKLGEFQGRHIEVEVTVYPITGVDPTTQKPLIGVRFGQMNLVRFVDRDLLYDMQPLKPKV